MSSTIKTSTTLAQFKNGEAHAPAGSLIHSFDGATLNLAEMPDETWAAPKGQSEASGDGWFCVGDGLGTHEWRKSGVVAVEFGAKGEPALCDLGIW